MGNFDSNTDILQHRISTNEQLCAWNQENVQKANNFSQMKLIWSYPYHSSNVGCLWRQVGEQIAIFDLFKNWQKKKRKKINKNKQN